MKRYIGLDLGTTTLGVSITDKTNTLVSPVKLIKFKRENYDFALNELIKIAEEKKVKDFVLGLPKNMDNSLGFAANRSLNFKTMLEEKGFNVYLEDERLTTVEALNIMKNNGMKNIKEKEKTDILSAVLILETFLKREKYEK
ncbi:putative Holliday junction resolvase [Clostridium sp. CAG:609]|nr:putative Holliday junction resolvase [Clostridium sp. CAG:609]